MPCPKPKPIVRFLTNFAIVLGVCLVVDFIVYGLVFKGSNPYFTDIVTKVVYTVILAAAYAHIYNKASLSWAPASKVKFVYQKLTSLEADDCKATWPKLLNGMIFSVMASLVVLTCIVVSGLFISFIYLYVLHGACGDVDAGTAAGIGAKLITSGLVLEVAGKTEDDPRM